MDQPSSTEIAALERIRRWQKLYWVSFAATLPAVALWIHAVGEHGWWWTAVLPAGCLFGYGLAARRVNGSPCPRCGEPFFHQDGPLGPEGTTLPAPRRCQGCDLGMPG